MSYIDTLEKKGVPVLGMLVWYNVPTAAGIPRDKYVSLIRRHKAPMATLKEPKPANVFRRALEEVQEKKWQANGESWDITTKDLGYSLDVVTRSITASHKVDGKLAHIHLADVTFNKKTKAIDTVANAYLPSYLAQKLNECYDFIFNYVKDNASIINQLQLRDAIRNAIEGPLRGILVKEGGGVYFVPRSEYTRLVAVGSVVAKAPSIQFHITPLIKDSYQVAMVANALSSRSDTELKAIKQTIAEYQVKSPNSKKLTDLETDFKTIDGLLSYYYTTVLRGLPQPSLSHYERDIALLWEPKRRKKR